ncbi:MAG: hypothetical protein KatS3mg115_1402 [Candidatus Poribacteria bacterium]|nr:MAG: hypothetical protein KatS3mg115_1402 [Candidatus Poribacteria bacterium]
MPRWIGLFLWTVACLGRTEAEPLLGQLIRDPAHPDRLSYAQDADENEQPDPAFLCGPGGPEGFLYGDISGGADQETVIQQIAEHGGNVLYLIAVRSHGGDGGPTENPFREHDPRRGLDSALLERWERWFQQMEQAGITIFFLFYDDDVDLWNEAAIAPAERAWIEGIVNAFEHHPNLIWIVAEEYQESFPPEKVRRLAALIREADDYDHLIGVHQLPGTEFHFADAPELDLFAMQLGQGVDTLEEVYSSCRQAVEQAAGRYSVLLAELHPWHADLLVQGDRATVRKINWTAAMARVSGVLHLGTWETAQDRRPPTPEMLADYRRLHRFLEGIEDLNALRPDDRTLREGKAYLLSGATRLLAYLPEGGTVVLDLKDQREALQAEWYNPRTGERRAIGTIAPTEHRFTAPDASDWLLHLNRP